MFQDNSNFPPFIFVINLMYLIRYLFIFISLPILGQVSQEGRFSVDFNKGCAPLSINLTVLDTFGTITRQYFYEDQSTVTTSQTHTYDTAGIYTLVQLVGIDVDPKTDTLLIEVLEPIAPTFDYFFCDGREIYLEINDTIYDSYEVLFANNQMVTLLNNDNTNYTFSLSDPLSIDVRGIYSNAADNCATSSIVLDQVFDDLVAPDVTTMELTQTCEDQFSLTVTTVVEPEIIYQVQISQSGSAYTTLFNGILTSPLLIENIAFSTTETEYCIRINAENFCDGSITLGNPTCQQLEIGDLDPIRNLYSSYSGNQIQLFLEAASSGSFLFQRSFDQSSFSTIGQSQGDFTDESPFIGRQYYYQVSYQDTCNGTWGQQVTSPPFIKKLEISTNKHQIQFTPADHQTGESFNYIARLSGGGNTTSLPITENTFELRLKPGLGNNQTLRIIGTSASYTVQSNLINFVFEFIIYVPKAFTPNGDGLNDRLELFGLDGNTATLNIYTRWGQQIYGEFSSAPAWDGLIDGHMANEGIYVYEISVPALANHVQKGTFVLIKK